MDGRTWLLEHARATDALQGIDPDVTSAAVDLLANWYDEISAEHSPETVNRRILEATDSVLSHHGELLSVYPAAVQMTKPGRDRYVDHRLIPWLESYHQARPAERIGTPSVPSLVLLPMKDAVVPAKPNISAWNTLASGQPLIQMVTLPGVNHGFQPCEACTAEEAEHSELTVDPAVIDRIAQWATERLQR